jgi:predicted glutamine amidotransferase
MCRMIFAVGKFNMDWLIQDFILMAFDQNEKHEKNIDKEFKHGDGWGIAYLEGNEIKIDRSIKAVYEDDQINQYKNLETNFVILHARKASKGTVNIQNVHPFECKLNGNHYLFFHNGTIRDEIHFDNQFQPVGTTDSERLFYSFLSNTNGQLTEKTLRSRLIEIRDFTAANFMLTDGRLTYVSSWYSANPKYYTFRVLQKPGLVVIASEVLLHYKAEDWLKLENHDIVTVRTSNLKVKIN